MLINFMREVFVIIVCVIKEVILLEIVDQREKSWNNVISNYFLIGVYYVLFVSRVERLGLKKKQSMCFRKL